MDEDFIDVTEKPNRLPVIIFILIIVFLILFGYFFVYKKFNFTPKTITHEEGEPLSKNVADYLKYKPVNTSGYNLDTSDVDINEIGEYRYKITYNNKTKKGTIKIVDTTPPKVTTKDLTVEVGDKNFYVGNFVAECKEKNTPCITSFKNERDKDKINRVGTYNISIVVSDIYDNKTTTKVKLNVVDKGTLDVAKEDFKYDHASVTDLKFDGEYYLKLDTAINSESEDAENNMTNIASKDWLDYASNYYPSYTLKNTEIIELYNKYDYIIGYAVRLTLDNGNEKKVLVEGSNTSSSDSENANSESTGESTSEE